MGLTHRKNNQFGSEISTTIPDDLLLEGYLYVNGDISFSVKIPYIFIDDNRMKF